MIDFKKAVSEKIKEKSSSKEEQERVSTFWHEIYDMYGEGGEAKIKEEINLRLQTIKEKFKEEEGKIKNETESL